LQLLLPGRECVQPTLMFRQQQRAKGLHVGIAQQLDQVIPTIRCVPALTPKALAARLKVAPQTGTALLRELQGRGWSGR
jgi:DNA-binding MarR family transcriptional regulator